MQDYRKGQELVKNRDFKANEKFFQDVFEVGRRYKIMNPDRMRGTYGKLLYMLMDTADGNIEELLEFSCIKYVLYSCLFCIAEHISIHTHAPAELQMLVHRCVYTARALRHRARACSSDAL